MSTVDVPEYQRLKKRADELKAESDRAAGSLATVLTRLKNEFGCETIEAAEAKLVELRAAEERAATAYNTALAAFKEKFGDYLEG